MSDRSARAIRPVSALFLGAGALAGAWLVTRARQRLRKAEIARRQLAALTDAIGSLARATAPDDFLAGVLRAIGEQLEARWVLLFLHDPGQDVLAVHMVLKDGQIVAREQATPNLARPVPARDVPVWDELERVRRPIHVADVRTDPRLRQREALVAQGVRSMLVVPLFIGEGLIGWFSVRSTTPQHYRQDQLDLAAALAQQAALAVQLGRLGEQGRQAAVLGERNRIAHEIHDTLAQGFTGILMQLEATESALETARPELAVERLGRARELARASLGEARRSVWALRPAALERQPFLAALRTTAGMLTAGSGLQLYLETEGTPGPLPPDLETDLLRVAQEAIGNAVRHAAARTLVVRVATDDGQVLLEICDDGHGFVAPAARPADGSGFGLTAMRERVARHGGRLDVQSAPGRGTRLTIRVACQGASRG
jgi:signal transduction histidine kinase